MSLYPQSQGILRCRNELDDGYNSKVAFRFSPIQGPANGTNLIFQIPQTRLVIPAVGTPPSSANSNALLFPQLYVDDAPLAFSSVLNSGEYNVTDPVNGIITFTAAGKQPNQGNKFEATFNWTWFTDAEIDNHLSHAANEVGFADFCTSYDLNIPGALLIPIGATSPSDIPDALESAIIMLGAAFAARALSLRFATSYDTTAGDMSYSPSQMTKQYSELADRLEKQGYTARDDFYKGQSRQYSPAVQQSGFVLPNWTPPR